MRVLSLGVVILSCLITSAALAEYEAIHIDELGLTKNQQNRRNIASYGAIITLNAANAAGIILGFVPEPITSYSGEIASIVADNALKFTKAMLYAPDDYVAWPNTGDQCGYEFELPQSTAGWDNILGLWPKYGGDRLFYPFDAEISFGNLGVPLLYHANTDVNLRLSIPSATTFQADSEELQTVLLGPGIHNVEWRADTLWFPVWDAVLPSVLTAVMIGAEFKWASHIRKLRKLKSDKLELSSVKGNTRALKRTLDKLDRRIKLFEKIEKYGGPGIDVIDNIGGELTSELIIEAFFNGQNTVSRSRIQVVSVYDLFPPSISTSAASLTYEATDIGGVRASRYLTDMRSYISASDECGRSVVVVSDAPEFLPMGDTIVTWTVRDMGPAEPGTDHDGDGVVDDDPYFSRSITQTITVEDTQAPILVPPPGLVIESDSVIDLATQALGQPLVVDLADLHPDVSSSSNSPDGLIDPNSRARVTWTATDASANSSEATQLVSVKTPGTNTAPTVLPQSVETLTSKPVDIVLSGTDADVLPFSDAAPGDPGVADPLQFRIEQLPEHGEFVAPLFPYFINDYRTDTTGVLTDDVAFAQASNQFLWLKTEYCDNDQEIPVNFVFNPLFVHVTDKGEQYFLDYYAVCDPNGTGDPEIEERIRISRWAKDRTFIGHVNYNPSQGRHNASFVLDPDGNIYYLLNFGVNEYSLLSCSSDITGTGGSCSGGSFNYSSNDGGIDISRSKFARVDSSATDELSNPLVYLTDGERVNIYHGHIYKGQLLNDAGVADFLEDQVSNCAPIPGGGSNQGYGIELDSAGNLYIADTCGDRIHKFTPSTIDSDNNLTPGEYVGWMGQCSGSTNLACDEDLQHSKGYSCTDATCSVSGDGSGSGVGQFLDPVYLAMDPNDVLYVADYGNQRIQRFGPDGTFAGQAKSTGNGINAATEGGFILGNMGPPRHVSVNSEQFFVVDQSEKFVHVFDASPFKDITDYSATVTYVSQFDFHSDDDTFAYSVNDGLVDSNPATVTVSVARNYRQPLPTVQTVSTDEDQSVVIVLSASDPDGIVDRDFNGLDRLTFVITKQPSFGMLIPGGDPGDITLDPGTEVWTYKPNRDYHGADSFSFTVRDEFTDATTDGATLIPEPYSEADPVAVEISIESVNDVPIIEVALPERVAAGFPLMLQAAAFDDIGSNYVATLNWGDGQIDQNGEIVIDDNGTPNDSSDDDATMTGVIFTEEALSSIGQSPVDGMHTYTATGSRDIELCFRDGESLEACKRVAIDVEQLVAMNAETVLSTDEVAAGVPFDASINVKNAQPSAGVTGLDAENVTLRLEIPDELMLLDVIPGQGSCNVAMDVLVCDFGDMINGTTATVGLSFRGKSQLIYDQDIILDAEVSTDTPALADKVLGSASVLLKTVELDRDDDGLPNVFEAFYGVSEADADDDGDGLNNLAEFEAGTSPVDSDSDNDGISDGDESNIYRTNPLAVDTDGDGISDNDELTIHATDPLSSDSDDDGLPDQWEIDKGFDPLLADSSGDADGDGLSDAQEYQQGSDYLLADTDGDSLLDGEEVNTYRTDPLSVDTDADELNDDAELAAGTDQLKPDSDDDGLLDGEEVNDFGSLPLVADSDRDDLPDGWETRNGRDLLKADYVLAAGGLSSCALTDAGVECWGRNDFQQAPALVPGLNNPLEVTVGYVHACAIDEAVDGSRSVQCWGNINNFGLNNIPALVEPLQIAAGSYHTCALDKVAADTIEVKCWGRDNHSQVSDTPGSLERPIRLVSSTSGNSSCVLDDTATGPQLVCWGQYNNANSQIPSDLSNDISALALGSEHGCVVDGGNQYCWGLNDDGQAPVGPEPVKSVQLSLGGFHSCSLDEAESGNYAVDCWGRNVDGQTDVPTSLVAPIQLASGSHHSCGLDQGSAKCWGRNANQEAPALKTLGIDPDGDTVPTAVEIVNGTNPLDADTDRDQLTDNLEIEYGTDPTAADTDGDGISDGDEVNIHLSDPLDGDSDTDLMPDRWELEYGLLLTVDDAAGDNDGDGLTNYGEYLNNTDPSSADSDGDGLNDGVELELFRYENSGQTLGNAASNAVELADLDDDGDLDALVANRFNPSTVWLNDGAGSFSPSTENVLLPANDVTLDDIDGDGDLDAVLANNVNPSTLWLNGESGDPQGKFRISEENFGVPATAIEFGRFNPFTTAPGLFFATTSNGGNRVYNYDAGAMLEGIVEDPAAGRSFDVAIGDLNGDLIDDAFVANGEGQANQVFLSVAVDAVSTTMVDSGQALGDGNSTAVALGDLDGDGDLDAFTANANSDLVWFNGGNGIFTDSGQTLGDVTDNDRSGDVSLLDVDGDGDLDAFVANNAFGLPNLGSVKLWMNDGAGIMSSSGLEIDSGNAAGISLGDVNGDGLPDIFLANDGPNTVWLLNRLDPNAADSDGDGALDGWEVDNGFDPLDDADGDLDDDLDGLSNADEFDAGTDPRDADSDGDGMPDGWEVSYGLDPLTDDSALDLDIDGLSNLGEYQQGGSPEADDVPPLVTAPGDVLAESTGLFTEVAIGTATAFDAKDGSLPVAVDDPGPYPSGSNNITWSATDSLGNVGVDDQLVDVIPLVNFSPDQVVEEGTTAVVAVELNGPAVNYPVQVDYSISGAATYPEDHDAFDGSVLIEEGIHAEILIDIVEDAIFDPAESFVLSMERVVNAVPGSQTSHSLLISENNYDGCYADFDTDGDTDGSDLASLVVNFGETACTGDYCAGDADGDSDVDLDDLAIFAKELGRANCP